MASPSGSVIYAFGDFRLNAADLVLRHRGSPVPLAPKVTETLLVLVERAGDLVTKEELMTRLWPDTFVDESNLAQNIFRLRRTLSEASGDTYIETVPRRGYRFEARVQRVENGGEAPAVRELPGQTPPARRRWAGPMVAALALVFLAVAFAFTRTDEAHGERGLTAAVPGIEKLTTESRAYDPAISPDGRYVAYAVLDGESKSIWLKNLSGGSAVQVMPPSPLDYRGLRFSPSGNELFYKTYRPGVGDGFIERVPAFGGAGQEVASRVWSDFGFSPDGLQVVFVRGSARPTEDFLLVAASVSGGGERVIGRNTPTKNWFALWDSAPSWSPDGRHVAICGGVHTTSGDRDVIFDVDVSTGDMRELPSPHWWSIDQAAWLSDGVALIVVAREAASKPAQIWMLDSRSGTARRITNDLNDYRKLSLTTDSRLLVIEHATSSNHIWVTPPGGTGQPTQLTFGAPDSDGLDGLAWTTDGRLLFVSNRTGEYEIWSMNPDGSSRRQLTVHSRGFNRSPRMTPDGRYIVFVSDRSGSAHLWRMDPDGSNPVQLTNGVSEANPDVSPDSRWVYYTEVITPAIIERVPLEGGQPERVTVPLKGAFSRPTISPDGATMTFNIYDEKGSFPAIMDRRGGPARRLPLVAERGVIRWSSDGSGLLYIKPGTVTNLWLQPLPTGEPRQLTHFEAEHIWNFAVAPDGRFALARGSTACDIILLSRFR